MKKYSLFKTIALCFFVVVVLSWVIPTGSFNGTTFTSSQTVPVGIINLFRLPVMTIQTFIQYFIVLLAIGAFYGVLNKTGVYGGIVNNAAKKMKGKERLALIITIITFALLATLTGNSILLFALVPFTGAVLLKAGFGKVTTMLATIGSILVGEAGSIFGFTGAGYIKNMFSISMTDEIITKIIVFILLIGLFVFYVLNRFNSEKSTKTKVAIKEIPFLTEEVKNDKSKLPLIIFSILLVVLCFVGMYNWYYAFGITTFNKFHTALTEITIGDYPIVSNIISGISSIGYWGNYEFAIALVISSVIISWLYNVSINDMIDGAINGMKEMLPIAFLATICNVVFTVMLSSDTNMFTTIVNWFGGFTDKFSLPIVTVLSIIGSFFYNDFYYLLNDINGLVAGYDAIYYPITGVITTAIHSLMMMILPTSVMLIAGLKFFNVSLKDWFKSVWKYMLEALVVIILVAIIIVVLI